VILKFENDVPLYQRDTAAKRTAESLDHVEKFGALGTYLMASAAGITLL